jgi:hypothetical protein
MSLKNRARALQKKTGLTYQQALQRLRSLGDRPAKLRRQTDWPLEVCDRFLVDGHAPISVVEAHGGEGPIEVVDEPRDLDAIEQVCKWLRTMSAARSVLLVDARGRVIALSGQHDRSGGSQSTQLPSLPSLPKPVRTSPVTTEVRELENDRVLVRAPVKPRRSSGESRITTRAYLNVEFERAQTALGLVRLRMWQAVTALEQLLAGETPSVPPAGGGGEGGAPNELRIAEPTHDEPPKKKPTPMGRNRKRER